MILSYAVLMWFIFEKKKYLFMFNSNPTKSGMPLVYIYKGRVYVCPFVMSSLLNGFSERKTDYSIKFIRVQGRFLGQLKSQSSRCVLLITKEHLFSGILPYISTNSNPSFLLKSLSTQITMFFLCESGFQ